MGCVNCKKIRDAILHGKMAEAAGLTVEVLREKMGFADAPEAPPFVGETTSESVVLTKPSAKDK